MGLLVSVVEPVLLIELVAHVGDLRHGCDLPREAMAMDVIFRARSSWSYRSVGITAKMSSPKSKSRLRVRDRERARKRERKGETRRRKKGRT
jgi:hypothetical protein